MPADPAPAPPVGACEHSPGRRRIVTRVTEVAAILGAGAAGAAGAVLLLGGSLLLIVPAVAVVGIVALVTGGLGRRPGAGP